MDLFLLGNVNYVIGKSKILFLPIAIGIRNLNFVVKPSWQTFARSTFVHRTFALRAFVHRTF